MLSLNCSVDFDSDLWAGFDAGMKEEWNLDASTSCQDVSDFPQDLHSYKNLANKLIEERSNQMLQRYSDNFTAYFDFLYRTQNEKQQVVFLTEYSESVFIKPTASGVAYAEHDLAFVKNKFEYSTSTLSHEILHLVLEEEGYERSCYVDKVHENQYLFSIKKTSDSNARFFPIIHKFDC